MKKEGWCPFHNRKDYENLKNLEKLAKETGLNESVKYLSYEKKEYPWMKKINNTE